MLFFWDLGSQGWLPGAPRMDLCVSRKIISLAQSMLNIYKFKYLAMLADFGFYPATRIFYKQS
jgi:hypothetical protein